MQDQTTFRATIRFLARHTRALAAVLIVLALAGAAGAAEPIRVGAVFSITGPAAWLGEPERDTIKLLADQINAAGGINGRPLEVIIEDDGGDETKSVLAVKKLIGKDRVVAIIGPSTSGASMAVLPIAEKEGVPLISCAAAVTIVTPLAERRWIFKTAQSDTHAAQRIFEHLKSKGITRAAIITVSNGYGDSGRKELKAAAPAFGVTIVSDERYGPADNDMTAQLTKIKGSDAQVLINWSIGPPQVIVTKNFQQLGMKIPLYQSHGFGSLKNIEQAGSAAEGVRAVLGRLLVAESLPETHPQKKILTDYKKSYEARFGKEVSAFGGYAWDALQLVTDALRQGGPDRQKVRDLLETRRGYSGVSGVFFFSPEDHNGLTKEAFEILSVKNGRFVMGE